MSDLYTDPLGSLTMEQINDIMNSPITPYKQYTPQVMNTMYPTPPPSPLTIGQVYTTIGTGGAGGSGLAGGFNGTAISGFGNHGITAPSITITDDGDITIKGKKLSARLDAIEQRLSIVLDPDPKKLEKYAALKIAYERYKLLEKLCYDNDDGK